MNTWGFHSVKHHHETRKGSKHLHFFTRIDAHHGCLTTCSRGKSIRRQVHRSESMCGCCTCLACGHSASRGLMPSKVESTNLGAHHLSVRPRWSPPHQVPMRPLLYHRPRLHHRNLVCDSCSREPVRDHNTRAPGHHLIQYALHTCPK